MREKLGKKAQIRREIVSRAMAEAISRRERHHEDTRQQLKDEIAKRESFIAPDGTADVTKPEVQRERYLMRADFVQRLQKLNPNLIYERSNQWPDFGGLYIEECVLGAAFDGFGKPDKRFLCGIPHEAIAEFDVRIVIEDKVPDPDIALHWIKVPQLDEHIPGWRSTLLKLVKHGVINLAAAEIEFEITKGRSSQRWHDAVN